MKQSNFLETRIRPAFSSVAGALWYISLVLLVLGLPLLLRWSGAARKDTRFLHLNGSSNINIEIFERTEDIDILFLGNSYAWDGIDARFIKNKMTERLGREAIVLNFGVNWPGKDILYVLLKELLERRNVRLLMLVMNDTVLNEQKLHRQFPRWWRFGENPELEAGLPINRKPQWYAGTVMGGLLQMRDALLSPRHFPTDLSHYGSSYAEIGFPGTSFRANSYSPPVFDSNEIILSPADYLNSRKIKVSDSRIDPYVFHSLKLLENLIKNKRIITAILNVPHFGHRDLDVVVEPLNWPEYWQYPMATVGVCPRKLFQNLSQEQIKSFYYDEHMNRNGCGFFTRAIYPAISVLYKKLS